MKKSKEKSSPEQNVQISTTITAEPAESRSGGAELYMREGTGRSSRGFGEGGIVFAEFSAVRKICPGVPYLTAVRALKYEEKALKATEELLLPAAKLEYDTDTDPHKRFRFPPYRIAYEASLSSPRGGIYSLRRRIRVLRGVKGLLTHENAEVLNERGKYLPLSMFAKRSEVKHALKKRLLPCLSSVTDFYIADGGNIVILGKSGNGDVLIKPGQSLPVKEKKRRSKSSEKTQM